jgi:uncharacterized protein (TIGR02145 family)
MKQLFNHILLTVALGCIAGMGIVDTHAQVPTRFNHQAVVRDTLGQLMANRTLSLRISLEQSAGGASVVRYREVHQVTTNANGLFTLEVGGGTVEQGQMDSVNWSAGSVFLRTEVDPAGGQNYVLSSHRELLSVPYALYSLHARNAPVSPQAGQINYWNGTEWVTLPPGNSGSVLSMCNGVPVWGPCPNSPSLATVSTLPVTQLTGFSASTGGNVTSDGGSPVTYRGVVYDTTSNPSLLSNYTVDGSGTGSFVSSMNNLTPATLYYTRAYATNIVGTAYGNEVTFTTMAPFGQSCPGSPTATDVDGNVYNTVQIGTQCWTQSNLKVSKYRDGSSIPNITDNTLWAQASNGAWSHYDNDYNNDDFYGKLYNWHAVNDSRGLCPTGWHVPTDAEWNTLVRYLDPNAYTATVGWQSTNAGGALKSTSSWWNSPNTGATNSSGFTALPGGHRSIDGGGGFSGVGEQGFFWSSSVSGSFAWSRYLSFNNADVYRNNGADGRYSGLSVRCARDTTGGSTSAVIPSVTTASAASITANSAIAGGNVTSDGGAAVTARGVAYGTSANPTTSGTSTSDGTGTGVFTSQLTGLTASTNYYVRTYATNSAGTAYGNEVTFSTTAGPQPCPGSPTATDVDGNVYNTVQIGTQCWTQSNLTVSKYRNGDNITNITGVTQWSQTNTSSTGAWCNYNNDASNGTTYGKLYNWYAVNDSRGLCPTGWHVPTNSEWNVMVKYLDPNADTTCANCWQSSTAGGAMKSTTGWASPNTGATNSSGFSGLPGGARDPDRGFIDFIDGGRTGFWWGSSGAGSGGAWYRGLYCISAGVDRYTYGSSFGFSVRCTRD